MLVMAFLAGVGTGVVLSAPIGPMGALTVIQAAQKHLRAAWMVAFGVCAADTLLAFLATWGVELPIPHVYLSAGVALLMLGLAFHLWRTSHSNLDMPKGQTGMMVGFVATLIHPANLVAFALLFSWLHGAGLVMESLGIKLLVVSGVLLGALAAWGVLIHFAVKLGAAVGIQAFQKRFKLGLAVICLLTAAWAAYEAVRGLV